MIGFLLGNWKIFAVIGAVIALLSIAYAYQRSLIKQGYHECEQDVIIKTVTITEKRNEIANKRPDTSGFLDGLLTDDNW